MKLYPRDELPQARSAVHTQLDAQCDKLNVQARWSNVDRCKYCQLSSTDGGPVYHASRPSSSSKLTTRCDDRRAVAIFLSREFRTKFPREVVLFLEIPTFRYNTMEKESLHAKNQLDPFTHFTIVPRGTIYKTSYDNLTIILR